MDVGTVLERHEPPLHFGRMAVHEGGRRAHGGRCQLRERDQNQGNRAGHPGVLARLQERNGQPTDEILMAHGAQPFDHDDERAPIVEVAQEVQVATASRPGRVGRPAYAEAEPREQGLDRREEVVRAGFCCFFCCFFGGIHPSILTMTILMVKR